MQPLGDKLLLPNAKSGIPILAQVIRNISTVASSVYVTYASQTVRQAVELHVSQSVHWILDEPGTEGPLHALGHLANEISLSPATSIIVAAGDIPGLHRDVFRACAKRLNTRACDGAAVVFQGRLQPLAAIYRSAAFRAFQDAALQGETRLMNAIRTLSIERVALPPHLPEWAIRPVHTPDDYNAYRAWRDALETS